MESLRTLQRIALAPLIALAILAGCTGGPSLDQTVQLGAVPTVTTDMATYTPGQAITVSWTATPGNPNDWVAIVPASSPPDSGFIEWHFTNSQVDGSQAFGGLPAGSYEARTYVEGSYTIIASTTFTVMGGGGGGGPVTVTTNAPSYAANQQITVSWTGLPGNQNDWVAIVPSGSPPDSGFGEWHLTNGQVNGSQVFAGLPAGNYEARAYQAGSYTILGTATFTVGTAVTVMTNMQSYVVNQPITVSWTGMPGNASDWVAITTAGSPPDSGFVDFFTINGQVNGSHQFTGVASNGTYEARMYQGGGYTILASTTFTVGSAPTVTTNQATYVPNQPITVSWTGTPGNQNDWVAIVTAGSPSDSGFQEFHYTMGQVNGSQAFAGLPTGNYEARTYLAGSYTIIANAAFTVGTGGGNSCTPASTPPVLSGIQSGDIVLDSTQRLNTAGLTAPLGTSILFISTLEAEPSPQYGGVMCTLHDVDSVNMLPAGVTCIRGGMGTDTGSGTVVVHYVVATFSSGVTVQRGVANTGVTNPSSISISSVDPTQSFVLLSGTFTGGTGWGNNEFVRAELLSGTSLDVRTTVAGTQVPWQVVTMNGASVQRGTASLASGATSQAVTIANAPSGSMALVSYNTDNPSGIAAGALMLQSSLADPTTLLLSRDLGGAGLNVSWEIISLPFATHSGLATLSSGQASTSASVTGGVSASSSVALTSSQALLGQGTGSTDFATTDIVGEASATLTMGAGSVSVQRASTQGSAEIPWTVIDFAHDCNGN